jgi:subtilase family serine protease
VTFPVQNPSQLSAFLSAVSLPSSPFYHQYLTAKDFDSRYGGNPAAYAGATDYFRSFGVDNLQTSADRLSLGFAASPAEIQAAFHATVDEFDYHGTTFVAPAESPELPTPLALAVASVEGLSTLSRDLSPPESVGAPIESSPAGLSLPLGSAGNYLAPVTFGDVQFEYAPDFQVAYDELPLFEDSGYPTNETIATILWSGTNSTGTPVGPFVPSDVYDFYNETLPASEPHAHVYGVPLDGAPPPGPTASYDTTDSSFENTLDLEMAGSTAPGASIYDVYGPSLSLADLDGALSYILNPSDTPGLANVSVISNSWGFYDHNDTTWYEDLQEAQARGISILACSGDSADNPASSKNFGGPDDLWFPSSMAYDSFGVTAVGGTTTVLNANLELQSQVAWNDTVANTGHGVGPVGSTGGTSTVFPEPSWQRNTSANSVIEGVGRATPDIAAIANNTLMTFSIDGRQYRASNATYGGSFYFAWGTSIASPLDAGIVCEIDHSLAAQGIGVLGFLNPQLYTVANREFSPSSLPTTPLVDVTLGSNDVYSAHFGYDLVTGWGSIDAYNYTRQNTTGGPPPGAVSVSGLPSWVYPATAVAILGAAIGVLVAVGRGRRPPAVAPSPPPTIPAQETSLAESLPPPQK